MPREISTRWWEQVARAIFGYQEHTPLALEDEIRVVADLTRLRPEWMFAAGMVAFRTDRVTATGVAGQFASVGIWNPPTSGMLVVVEAVQQQTGSELNVVTGAVDTAPGTLISAVQIPRDTRWLTPAAAVPLSDTPSRFTSVGVNVFTRVAVGQITSNVKAEEIASDNTTLLLATLQGWTVVGEKGFVALEGQVTGGNAIDVTFSGYAVPLRGIRQVGV